MKEILLPYGTFFVTALLASAPLVSCSDFQKKYFKIYDLFFVFTACVGICYIFGSRDFNVGTDTPKYVQAYLYIEKTKTISEAFSSPFIARDPLYNLTSYFLSRFMDVRAFFYTMSGLFILPILISVFRLSSRNRGLFLLAFFGLFCVPNLGVNIIRSGLSLSFALLAITYFKENKLKNGIILSVISFFFHVSSLLIFLIYFGSKFLKRRLAVLIFFLSSILAVLRIGLKDFPIIGRLLRETERISSYAEDGSYVSSSLPYSYLLMHCATIAYGVYISRTFKDLFYERILIFYILITSSYFLMSNMAFAYRFGILSWFFIPVILCYPILNNSSTKNFANLKLFGMIIILSLFSLYQVTR